MDERVLVVDDDPSVRQILRRKLEREGYEVVAVQSAKRAMEEMEAANFDLVLTDVRMRQMDGIGLTRHVKERYPDTKVVLITAVVDMDSALAGLRGGASDYITKPFNLEEVAVRVRNALERPEVHAFRVDRFVHDVNGPLGAIIGFSQLILDREDIGPEVRDSIELILQESEKIHLRVLQVREAEMVGGVP